MLRVVICGGGKHAQVLSSTRLVSDRRDHKVEQLAQEGGRQIHGGVHPLWQLRQRARPPDHEDAKDAEVRRLQARQAGRQPHADRRGSCCRELHQEPAPVPEGDGGRVQRRMRGRQRHLRCRAPASSSEDRGCRSTSTSFEV